MSKKVIHFFLALGWFDEEFDPEHKFKFRKLLYLDEQTSASGQRAFYHAALKELPWLSHDVRLALQGTLGIDIVKHKRSIDDARTMTMKKLVEEEQQRLSDEGKIKKGVRVEAEAVVAAAQGIEQEALKKRVQRLKAPRRPRPSRYRKRS